MSLASILQTAGLRRTKARETVLKLLSTSGRPMTHQEITNHPEANELDRVTLYRILTALQQANLVHRVQGTDGSLRFCFRVQKQAECSGNHPHFLCVNCNQMECLIGQSLPWVSVQEGAEIIGKQLVVYGLCPKCARNKKK